MPILLLSLFLGVPLIEVYLFIELGSLIGALWTVLLCVATAVTGAALVRHQGRAVTISAQEAMRAGRMPAVEAFDGICILAAGMMLLTPGFFTDTGGLLLLMPPVRHMLRHFAARHVETVEVRMRAGPGGPVMDGEWEVVNDPAQPRNDPRLRGPGA
ncbi:MAG: FxsA family protein [Rhodospirillales bacterium]|nr:FxsA family protein [Rhodospirillales bacterium]